MELTSMQAAYWVGRGAQGRCGGVAAHLFTEFDGAGLDPERLGRAVRSLVRAHPMLRLRITPAGRALIMPLAEEHRLKVQNLSDLPAAQVALRLEAVRREMTHQRLDIETGTCFDIRLSLLPGGRHRLHLDLDMIAADPSCLGLILDDLARFHDDPGGAGTGRLPPEGCFFDYLQRCAALPDRREAARDWWWRRMSELPPEPPLPWREGAEAASPITTRLSAQIAPDTAAALDRIARNRRVTPTVLYLAVFAAVLGRATEADRFRISVPTFLREPVPGGTENLVGDFSNMTLAGFDLQRDGSLESLLPRLQEDMNGLLAHLDQPGVAVLRDLSRLGGGIEGAPVVFTSGLNPRGGTLVGPRAGQLFGDLVWTISQAPQVALDVQLARMTDGVLVNWDVRLDALPEAWLRETFAGFVAALKRLAEAPELIARPFSIWIPASRSLPRKLGPLLRAYLLGRQPQMPLGGVPMQDFRLYRGRIDAGALRARLAAEVAIHPALRSRIDPEAMTVTTDDEPFVPSLPETDLSGLSGPEAETRLAAIARGFATGCCDLSAPPWQMALVRLPGNEQALLVRFDALILDGEGISRIMRRLLSAAPPEAFAEADFAPPETAPAEDEAYWTAKLAGVDEPPQLPWVMPLEDIRNADWHRDSVTLPRAALQRLMRIGADNGLFRNSLLMAVLLEVLTRWTPHLSLCVGIPIALPASGPLANRSSFLAVTYDARDGKLPDRAARFQADIRAGMQHTGFSGVDLGRMLMARNGGRLALPVVITNALGWDRPGPDDAAREVGGLTRTPQVAMDLRLMLDAAGNLVLALDHVRQAVPARLSAELLAAMARALTAVAERGALALAGDDFLPAPGHDTVVGTEFSGPGFLTCIARNLWQGDPARPALVAGGCRFNHGQLGQLVARLRGGFASRGLGRGDVVAICLPRGPEHLATSIACALSGLTWVPIDADSPPERLDYLLRNCQPRLVVAETGLHGALTFAEVLADPAAPPRPEALEALERDETAGFYLYTSGTTGRPKCVVLSNRATANTIGHTLAAWDITPTDRVMSITPLHHDMSVFDLFGTLAAGATLVMPAPDENKDAVAWNDIVRREGVTVWTSVPAMVEMLLACEQGGSLGSLRLVAQGGDHIKPAVIARLRQLLPGAALWSLGGPTETTIWSIWHPVAAQDRDRIPYGRASPGNRYLILNELAEPCPAGVPGRIHTAGVNLARGYLVDGALTQTDFIELPAPPGLRAFRTGDIGSFREDGVILFGARIDGYVKVRGVRVSLDDVAGELSHHPGLKQVLVVDVADPGSGDVALAALVVGTVAAAELRSFAAARLPQSHVPTSFIPVPALPLSANGKPDRHKARAIAGARLATSAAPDTVLAACLSVIGKPDTMADEDTPLLALGLLPSHLKPLSAALARDTGVPLALPALLQCRTAREIGALIEARRTSAPEPVAAR